mmetsp:Transcript_8203/g.21553  ORF Transcript_8203/g.21553 Transcript_8203/m.21553 type:complete len:301 (-) Transcript_8203:606-1508(-)
MAQPQPSGQRQRLHAQDRPRPHYRRHGPGRHLPPRARKEREQQELQDGLRALRCALPADAVKVAFGTDFTALLPISTILARLSTTYGTLSGPAIDDTLEILQQPYDGSNIRCYIAEIEEHRDTLTRSGQNFPARYRCTLLAKALRAERTNAHTVDHWFEVNPSPHEQTFRRLADAVLAADNRRPPVNSATTRTTGFAAPATTATAFATHAAPTTTAVFAANSRYTAEEQTTIRAARAICRKSAPATTGEFWCHTLGENRTHHSPQCQRPGEGHRTTATRENPMGGPLPQPVDGVPRGSAN